MQIVVDSPGSVKGYAARFDRVLASAPRECPRCGGRLKGHGRRHRWVVSLEGVFRVPIQRMICKACRKTFSLLPRILYAFRSCARKLVASIEALWERGKRAMSDVRYLLSVGCPSLKPPLPSLYRWAGHTG